jgi:hypothetical protein
MFQLLFTFLEYIQASNLPYTVKRFLHFHDFFRIRASVWLLNGPWKVWSQNVVIGPRFVPQILFAGLLGYFLHCYLSWVRHPFINLSLKENLCYYWVCEFGEKGSQIPIFYDRSFFLFCFLFFFSLLGSPNLCRC